MQTYTERFAASIHMHDMIARYCVHWTSGWVRTHTHTDTHTHSLARSLSLSLARARALSLQRDDINRYNALIDKLGIRDAINLLPPRFFPLNPKP